MPPEVDRLVAENAALSRDLARQRILVDAAHTLHSTLDQDELLGLILETASGRKSKSEEFGYGDDEFAPWTLGATM